MDLLLLPGQPGPQVVAVGVEMRGGRAFQVFLQDRLRRPRADGCGQIVLQVFVFAARFSTRVASATKRRKCSSSLLRRTAAGYCLAPLL